MNQEEVEKIITEACDRGTKIYLVDRDMRGIDLSGMDLSWAIMTGAILMGANLEGANLNNTILERAHLSGARMKGATMIGADLINAYLMGADLRGADFTNADLTGANLMYANLMDANLTRADLRGAILNHAILMDADLMDVRPWNTDLMYADLRGAKNIPEIIHVVTNIVPEEGEIIGWKQLQYGLIAKLLIPAEAKRSNATGRKCRAEYARVLAIYDGEKDVSLGISQHDNNLIYRVGETVYCDRWDDDRWNECSGGIHFFITRCEAENY